MRIYKNEIEVEDEDGILNVRAKKFVVEFSISGPDGDNSVRLPIHEARELIAWMLTKLDEMEET